MAKKKIYAVKKGKKTGIFQTWDACKAAVNGYSGAQYKSFFSEEEAQAYLNGTSNPMQSAMNESNEESVVAYVDGSFQKELGKYAFGCVLLLTGRLSVNLAAETIRNRWRFAMSQGKCWGRCTQ